MLVLGLEIGIVLTLVYVTHVSIHTDLCSLGLSHGVIMSQIKLDVGTQLLPGDNAAVLVIGRKVTGDIAYTVRYAKGLENVRRFW